MYRLKILLCIKLFFYGITDVLIYLDIKKYIEKLIK